MLNDNIRNLRKTKGYTQEELANRLNVTRQTISKWEKGYSVPDAELLKKMAEALEADVSQLLGGPIEKDITTDLVAEQLSRINEQLVIKNRRTRRIWKIIGVIALVILLVKIVLIVLGAVTFDGINNGTDIHTEENIEEVIE